MLAESLQCECNPGKIYSSASTFRAHKASKRHQDWEQKGQERQLRKRLGDAEAEVAKMHQKIHELETELTSLHFEMNRIRRVSQADKKKVAYQQNYECNLCHVLLPPTYEIDHITPLFKGGGNKLGNLQALCPGCHRNKTENERSS
jgi:5-methylcytosine-specific restriction endonuclease McrA